MADSSLTDTLEMLASQHVPMLVAIKTLVQAHDVPLSEAKRVVTEHRSWRKAAQKAQSLHDTVEQTLLS